MTGYLIDTNVLSESRKRHPNPGVQAWRQELGDVPLHISVLSLGEIEQGIARLRMRDDRQASVLVRWLTELEAQFEGLVLPVDRDVVSRWGAMAQVRTVAVIDGLIAATAIAHDLTLATRNTRDVVGLGVRVFNPFT